MNSHSQSDRAWHVLSLTEVLAELDAAATGLTEDEAKLRLRRFGHNRLPERKPPAVWQVLLRQFYNPLMYILVFAAVTALLVGDTKDAIFIAVALAINAAIGGYQEWNAERSSLALRRLLRIHATVQRNGDVRGIPAVEVVPGDVIWLESGNRVPADVRLLEATGLEIDESLLTGESLAVRKDPNWEGTVGASLGDRANLAFAGSIVTRGRGKGLVVATGTATAVGQLALDVVGTVSGKSPLLTRMDRFSKIIAIVTFVIAAVIGALGILSGHSPHDMLLFAIALAVAAVPSGLPVAMTVALAVAMTRMARRHVIVRRLAAVEGLGSCTLIATDKTGTLTVNELTVREVLLADGDRLEVTGEGFAPTGQIVRGARSVEPGSCPALDALIRAGVLCNEAHLHSRARGWEWHGDAVDIALLALAYKQGWRKELAVEEFPQVDVIPFESEHQYAATFNRVGGEVRAFVKGSPERVLGLCRKPVDGEDWISQWNEAAHDLARRGFRVLALAEGFAAIRPGHAPSEPSDLNFLGFVGMIDPLRAGVREAIRQCREAGVEVAMITGDHRVTALAIARDMGLTVEDSQIITGPEIADRTSEELVEIVRNLRVFARVAPRQKLQIVEAAQKAGHFVAVTGDGANDAPALRKANIGVAMGKGGTDVARETAELVLSDDNFASIVAGVDEGRIAYDNIRKVVFLLISTGATELLIMMLAILFGLPLPLIPLQLLWLNLVTSGIQDLALAFEPGEGDTLRRGPRPPGEGVFNRLMVERLVISSLVMAGIGFGAFAWMIDNGWSEPAARNVLLLLMVLFENFHLGNCRSESKSAFALSPLRSPTLFYGAIGAFLIHLAAMHIPFVQGVMETEPVSATTWLVLVPLAVLIVPAIELHKWTWRKRHGA